MLQQILVTQSSSSCHWAYRLRIQSKTSARTSLPQLTFESTPLPPLSNVAARHHPCCRLAVLEDMLKISGANWLLHFPAICVILRLLRLQAVQVRTYFPTSLSRITPSAAATRCIQFALSGAWRAFYFILLLCHCDSSPYNIHVSKIIIGHLNSGSNKTVLPPRPTPPPFPPRCTVLLLFLFTFCIHLFFHRF
jgi:hypothetical protein